MFAPRAISNRSFEELLLSLYPPPGEKSRLKGSWRFFENTCFFFFEEPVSPAEVSRLDVDGQRASLLGPFNVNDPSSFASKLSFQILLWRVCIFSSSFAGSFSFLSRKDKRSVDIVSEEKEEGGGEIEIRCFAD